MRGSETATAGLGVNPTWQRIVVFALSGAIAGVGGVLYSIQQQHVSPVDWNTTFSLVLVVLVVTTSVNTVEGAIQAGIGFFVIEQLLTYLPSRFGGPSLTIVLVRLRCADLRPAPRRGARVPEAPMDDALRAAVLRPRGRSRGAARRAPCRPPAPMADVEPLLSLHGVCKSFGGIQAVHAITFDVAPGESVGLVGPNGAGKTTLFNCVCGQLRPEAGDIVFDGTPLTGLPTYKRARLGIGRTYQKVEVFTDMSVRDHLMVAERLAARRGPALAGPPQHEQAEAGGDRAGRGHARPGRDLPPGGHVGQRARPGSLPPGRAGPGPGDRAEDPAGRRAVLRARPARDGRGGRRPAHGAARAGHGRAPGRTRPHHGGRGGRSHRRHGSRSHAVRRAPSTSAWPIPLVRDAYLGQMGLA